MSHLIRYPTVVDEHGAQQFRDGATYQTLVETFLVLWREFGDDAYGGYSDGFGIPFNKGGATVAYIVRKDD